MDFRRMRRSVNTINLITGCSGVGVFIVGLFLPFTGWNVSKEIARVLVFFGLILIFIALALIVLRFLKDDGNKVRYGFATYASGRYHYSLSVAGVNVVIDNIEESLENVSITGTVDTRPRAVVLNKKRLPRNLSAKEKLEKYAWALVEVDLKKKGM